MAGHSKWANIKHKKAATDAKRGKAFSMIGKLITVAVREGGSGDPGSNPRLRTVLEKARDVNMPKTNIQKAIDKGLGKGSGAAVEEILYEGFGPGGVGVMVKVLTDNKNRSGSEVKMIFDRSGGSLGGPGAVSYMFERNGESYDVKVPVPVDESTAASVQTMIEKFEDHEDVEFVVTNMSK